MVAVLTCPGRGVFPTKPQNQTGVGKQDQHLVSCSGHGVVVLEVPLRFNRVQPGSTKEVDADVVARG